MAGVADADAGTTVTAKLKRRLALSYCTRGSVRLSVLRSSRLRVTPPPHSTAPVFVVTCMNVLTVSTISVPLVAASGSGGWQPPQPVAWLMPSKLLVTEGARRGAAAGAPGRGPDAGRAGRATRAPCPDSATPRSTGGSAGAPRDPARPPKLTAAA